MKDDIVNCINAVVISGLAGESWWLAGAELAVWHDSSNLCLLRQTKSKRPRQS